MKKLPPDPDGMNIARIEWAGMALAAFQDVCRTDDEDALTDLLADLMHWADRNGGKFGRAMRLARQHYIEETRA